MKNKIKILVIMFASICSIYDQIIVPKKPNFDPTIRRPCRKLILLDAHELANTDNEFMSNYRVKNERVQKVEKKQKIQHELQQVQSQQVQTQQVQPQPPITYKDVVLNITKK